MNISKPFQIDEVMARVRVHIALKRAKSELAANYDRLRHLEKVRDNLVHMIIHDMRSPLSVILGNLELLRMVLEDNLSEKAAKNLDAATVGVGHLTDMANDLLDVSKMEEGKMSLKREACDLSALAKDVAGGFNAMDRSRTIAVDANDSAVVSCDSGIVRRILQNLISNAIKHTPASSAVRVVAQDGSNAVRVSVIDQGPGVPVESREKIFQKFGAMEMRKGNKYHSVGLGLAFCKLAIETHGGSIGVEANEPKGSIFWFELEK